MKKLSTEKKQTLKGGSVMGIVSGIVGIGTCLAWITDLIVNYTRDNNFSNTTNKFNNDEKYQLVNSSRSFAENKITVLS